MPCIVFHGDERAILVPKGTSILKASLENKIPHYAECGGQGKCTTCRVKVFSGMENLMTRNEVEMKQAQSRNWESYIRLACQSKIMGDIVVERLVKNELHVQEAYLEKYYSQPPLKKELILLKIKITGFEKELRVSERQVVEVYNQVFFFIQDILLLTGANSEIHDSYHVLGYYGLITEKNLLQNAYQAVFLIQSLFQAKQKEWEKKLQSKINLLIALNQAKCLIGTYNFQNKKTVQVLGNLIPKALKLIKICSKIKVSCLVSEDIYQNSKEFIRYKKKFTIENKVSKTQMRVFEPRGYLKDDPTYIFLESYFEIKDRFIEFAKKIYELLFERNPRYLELFQADMTKQYKVLANVLKTFVYGICRLEDITPMLRELGRRHKYLYGVQKDYFLEFEKCILIAMKEMLIDWNEKKEQAWKKTMDKLIEKILEGYEEDF